MQVQRGTAPRRGGSAFSGGTAVIYLDHAATTPLSAAAWRAMEPYLREHFGNPSEPHAAGRAARAGLDAARESVAATLGCAVGEVVFTGGGSEADNLAVLGRLAAGGRVVASAIEHPAVREPLLAYGGEVGLGAGRARRRGRHGRAAGAGPPGRRAVLRDGREQRHGGDPAGLGASRTLCAERGVPLHVDAVQAAAGVRRPRAAGRRRRSRSPPTSWAGRRASASLAGPGVASLPAVVRGGGQERGLRPGTENVAGAARWPPRSPSGRGRVRWPSARRGRAARPAGARGRTAGGVRRRSAAAGPRAAARGRARRPRRAPARRRRHLRRGRLRLCRGQRRALVRAGSDGHRSGHRARGGRG